MVFYSRVRYHTINHQFPPLYGPPVHLRRLALALLRPSAGTGRGKRARGRKSARLHLSHPQTRAGNENRASVHVTYAQFEWLVGTRKRALEHPPSKVGSPGTPAARRGPNPRLPRSVVAGGRSRARPLAGNLPQGYQPLECWDYPHQIGKFGAGSGLPQLQKEPSEQRHSLFLDRPNKGTLASDRDLIGGPWLLYVPAPPDSASTLAPARVFRAHDLHDLDVAAMSSRSASHRERSSAGTLLASQHSCPH